MKRFHLVAVALVLGAAATLGVMAAGKTAHVGAASHASTSNATIGARTHQLARLEHALRRALRNRPPALPRVPHVSPAPAPAASLAAAAPVPRVVYQRPAPVIVVKHTHHESEHEGSDVGGDGGGGGDD